MARHDLFHPCRSDDCEACQRAIERAQADYETDPFGSMADYEQARWERQLDTAMGPVS